MRQIPSFSLLRALAASLGVLSLGPLCPPHVSVSEVLVPTARAADHDISSVDLDECWFDGQRHTRNFGGVNYGPVHIILESLKNPPRGYGPRPYQITGLVMPGLTVGNRQATPEPSSGFNTGGEADVDPGHVFALHLGGPDDARNIVPQWARWQQHEAWRKMEQDLDKEARKVADDSRPQGGGKPTRGVSYNIAVAYRDTGTVTPTLTAWSFPKHFYVSACEVNLNSANGPCLRKILDNKKFEGGPPHD